MFLSIKTVVFACLSLASVGATLSNGDLLKMIDEQNSELEELTKMTDQFVDGERRKNETRHLKKKKKRITKRKRNVCYAKAVDSISVYVECSAYIDDDNDNGSADCSEEDGYRRVLTHDEARRNVQEFSAKRKLVSAERKLSYSDGDVIFSPFGFFEVGNIKIGKQ
jgi:hypothetical protein